TLTPRRIRSGHGLFPVSQILATPYRRNRRAVLGSDVVGEHEPIPLRSAGRSHRRFDGATHLTCPRVVSPASCPDTLPVRALGPAVWMSRRRWVVFGAAVMIAAVAACGGGGSSAKKKTVATTSPKPVVAPLTGLPDPSQQSLNRPALSVKIENTPESR